MNELFFWLMIVSSQITVFAWIAINHKTRYAKVWKQILFPTIPFFIWGIFVITSMIVIFGWEYMVTPY